MRSENYHFSVLISHLVVVQSFFHFFDENVFVFDGDAQTPVNAHPLIRQPRNRKKSENISAPIGDQKLKTGKNQK